MEAIYILSDPDSVVVNKYKVGITSRNKLKLLRDYRRSRPEVILYLFEMCENSKQIESEVLSHFEKFRILHQSGKMSEWIQIELNNLMEFVEEKIKINKSINFKIKEEPDVYRVSEFIKNQCYLTVGVSESCRVLYNDYLQFPNGQKLRFLNFCKILTKELSEYYKCPKNDLKYKSNKVIYYKGIQLRTNAKQGWQCIIL